MATRRPTGARNETIRCENCGEYYSVTYKRCPFCDERADLHAPSKGGRRDEYEDAFEDDEYEDDHPRRGSGGKRLVTNTRGGGYGRRISPGRVIWSVISLLLIAAAVYIVFTAVYPLIARGSKPTGTPGPNATPPGQVSAAPTPPGSAAPTGQPQNSAEPGTDDPAVTVTPIPPSGNDTATGFSLGKQDISLDDQWPTYSFQPAFTPAGATAALTWTSSKPDIVAVDANGKVSPGATQGVSTITAKMANGYEQSCIVRNRVSSSAAGGSSGSSAPPAAGSTAPSATPTPSAPPSSALSLNVGLGTDGKTYDFSLSGAGDSWTLKVKGTTSAVTWSVKDSSIVTVSDKGVVTAVAKGSTRVTATVDGQTLECIVRVQ